MNYRIVIIEDDRELAANMGRLIGDIGEGITVYEYHSLRDYVEACPEADAVLLDLNLPDSHGANTAHVVRKMTKTPVVVLTGIDDPEIKREVSALGVNIFVKPDIYGALETVAAAILYHEFAG